MSSPWPAPDADEAVDGRRRAPNFLLRRAAAIGVVAIVAVAGVVAVKRITGGDDDDGSSASAGARSWDTIVVQDAETRTISVLDSGGDEITTVDTDLIGVTDVGVDGKVVVGLLGTSVADGLAVLDLESGELTDLRVTSERVSPLGDSGLLLSSDTTGSEVELVDVADGSRIDLLDEVDADVDEPLVSPTSIRIDEQRSHIAFTELRSFETYVLSLDDPDAAAVSVAGSLVAMAFDRVVTATNRGDSALLDLSTVEGERVGTVEVPSPAAAMLVSDSTAIVVSRVGVVSLVDFDDESVDEVVDLAPVLPTAPGATEADDLIASGVSIASNTRLALFGDRFVAFVGPDGQLLKSIDEPEMMVPRIVDPEDRCLVVTGTDTPPVFIDVEGGSIIGSLSDSIAGQRSHDGCVLVAVPASKSSRYRVVGVDADVELAATERILALADDGTAAIVAAQPTSDGPTYVLPLPDGTTIDLGELTAGWATFAHR